MQVPAEVRRASGRSREAGVTGIWELSEVLGTEFDSSARPVYTLMSKF